MMAMAIEAVCGSWMFFKARVLGRVFGLLSGYDLGYVRTTQKLMRYFVICIYKHHTHTDVRSRTLATCVIIAKIIRILKNIKRRATECVPKGRTCRRRRQRRAFLKASADSGRPRGRDSGTGPAHPGAPSPSSYLRAAH